MYYQKPKVGGLRERVIDMDRMGFTYDEIAKTVNRPLYVVIDIIQKDYGRRMVQKERAV